MAYRYQKMDGGGTEIVVEGFEKGTQPSPHLGIASIKNANIATETGEVMASYGRAQASMTDTSATGNITYLSSSALTLSMSSTNSLFKGMWITVTNSSDTGQLPNGNYFVLNTTTGSNAWFLSTSYGGSVVSGFSSGLTANFTLLRSMGTPIAHAEETYFSSGTAYYRYYILDNQGLVWMYDTINDLFPSDDKQHWELPDTSITYYGSDTAPSGMGILNGWLIVLSGNKFWVKPTVTLGDSYDQMTNTYMMSRANSANPHFAYTGHQGRMYYTDGQYVGSIFPDTSLEVSGLPNIQSYCSYTATTTTGSISNLIAGSVPSDGNITSVRVPACFFPAVGGSLPTALTANTVYYIEYGLATTTFGVYAASTGGAALDIQTGSSGTQYFNTFFPVGTHAGTGGDHTTMVFSNQRLTLPTYEVSQSMTEAGNTLIVGTKSNAIYPWNQIDATPSNIIFLPEADTKKLLTVNQIAYIFAGNKGNIYVTDGSVASLVLKLPDYCAGVPGTATSYIEPNFTWGGVMYLRGRVYFSVLDQTSTKTGEAGGIWSFYPTQNLALNQDTGLALRLENQNSYGDYDGYATVLIPWFDQSSKSPQYWSGWTDAYTSGTQGIDKTQSYPVGTAVIETDLMDVGSVLDKFTPKQIEYKLAAPMVSGETVTIKYRLNATDAYATCGTVQTPDGETGVGGYFTANFQGAQWVQLEVTLNASNSTSTSFCRLKNIKIR